MRAIVAITILDRSTTRVIVHDLERGSYRSTGIEEWVVSHTRPHRYDVFSAGHFVCSAQSMSLAMYVILTMPEEARTSASET